jgi:hypothetical protein
MNQDGDSINGEVPATTFRRGYSSSDFPDPGLWPDIAVPSTVLAASRFQILLDDHHSAVLAAASGVRGSMPSNLSSRRRIRTADQLLTSSTNAGVLDPGQSRIRNRDYSIRSAPI